MKKKNTDLKAWLMKIPEPYSKIRDFFLQNLTEESAILPNGVFQIAYHTDFVDYSKNIWIFPGFSRNEILNYVRSIKAIPPKEILDFYEVFSGIISFGFSFYGIPESRIQKNGNLDRTQIQCHDLGLAQSWKNEYKGVKEEFHFGGRQTESGDSLLGYFFSMEKGYFGIEKNGSKGIHFESLKKLILEEMIKSKEIEEKRRICV